MAEFDVMVMKLKMQISCFQKIERELSDVVMGVSEVQRKLSLKNSYSHEINRALQQTYDGIYNEKCSIKKLGNCLSDIYAQYDQTERSIAVRKNTLKSIKEASSINGNTIWNNFTSNMKSDIFTSALESSGGYIGTLAGKINILTSIARSSGENAFVIINPNVAETTAAMVKGGNALKAGAKYGLPIIGGIIDFAVMKFSGESTQDAFVKAGAHVGIGLAGGAAGAKIGAVVGSVIPGFGTVAGAAIGFVAGAAITTVGNMVFDYVYDNWDDVVSGVQKATDYVADKVNDVVSGVGDVMSDIGNAICSPFQSLGALFG